MKTLIFIQGGQATGKMTVGQELSKLTNFKLFHNHMTVELANHFYGFGEGLSDDDKIKHGYSFSDLRDRLRIIVFDNIAQSYLPGLIFTGAMYYDSENNWKIVGSYLKAFIDGAKKINEETRILIVELDCSLEERLLRNETENRLKEKPSKQNITWSRNDILKQVATRRVIANSDDVKRYNADGFLHIENTNLSAYEVAVQIVKHFNL